MGYDDTFRVTVYKRGPVVIEKHEEANKNGVLKQDGEVQFWCMGGVMSTAGSRTHDGKVMPELQIEVPPFMLKDDPKNLSTAYALADTQMKERSMEALHEKLGSMREAAQAQRTGLQIVKNGQVSSITSHKQGSKKPIKGGIIKA